MARPVPWSDQWAGLGKYEHNLFANYCFNGVGFIISTLCIQVAQTSLTFERHASEADCSVAAGTLPNLHCHRKGCHLGSSLFFFHANGTPVGLTHSSIIYSGRGPCAAPGLLHKSLSNKVIGPKRSELSSREHGSIILGIPNFEQPNDARSCRKSKCPQGARCPLCNSFLQKKRRK